MKMNRKLSVICLVVLFAAFFASSAFADFYNVTPGGNQWVQLNKAFYPDWITTEGGVSVTQPIFDPRATDDWIREAVWIEVPVDTDKDGKRDLLCAYIIRHKDTAKTAGAFRSPVMAHLSPYNEGPSLSHARYLYADVDGPYLGANNPDTQNVKHTDYSYKGWTYEELVDLGYLNTSEPHTHANGSVLPGVRTTSAISRDSTLAPLRPGNLNPATGGLDGFLLARGFATVNMSMLGAWRAEGMLLDGAYAENLASAALVDWLNGRVKGYTNPTDNIEVKAYWATGDVTMQGTSYGGSLPTAAAITGVKGLRTIIPVAPVTSYYEYYRANGMAYAPGGWQGEDTVAILPYCWGRGYTANSPVAPTQEVWDAYFENVAKTIAESDRTSGNYNQYWADRNMLQFAENIDCAVIMMHGINDDNVKLKQTAMLWEAMKLYDKPRKLIYHQGNHQDVNTRAALNWIPNMHKWMDYYIWGIANDANESMPNVMVENNITEQSGANLVSQWVEYEDWPNGKYQKFYIASADRVGKLSINKPAVTGKAAFVDETILDLVRPKDTNPQDYLQYAIDNTEVLKWKAMLVGGTVNGNVIDVTPETAAAANDRLLYFLDIDANTVIDGTIKMTAMVSADKNVGAISAMLVDYGVDNYVYRMHGATGDASSPGSVSTTTVRTVSADFLYPGSATYNLNVAVANPATRPFHVVSRGSVSVQNPNYNGKIWSDVPEAYYAPEYIYQDTAIEVGKFYPYTWELDVTHYEVKAGHKLGLIIFGSDAEFTQRPYENPTKFTVETGANTYLSLPIVGTFVTDEVPVRDRYEILPIEEAYGREISEITGAYTTVDGALLWKNISGSGVVFSKSLLSGDYKDWNISGFTGSGTDWTATDGGGDLTVTLSGTVANGEIQVVISSTDIMTTTPRTVVVKFSGSTAAGGVKVTEMALPAAVTMGKGTTLDLNSLLVVSPDNAANKSVTWTASDPAVANVHSGVVVSYSEGDVTITATATDGGSVPAEFASTTLTVTDTVPPLGVLISPDVDVVPLFVGEPPFVIEAVLSPDNGQSKVFWVSSNPDVVSVDISGDESVENMQAILTPVSTGTARITVETRDGEWTATRNVSVGVHATGLTLDRSSFILNQGVSLTLVATITPAAAADKTVIWTSSNARAVSVDQDGVVTGVAVGNAVVTATAADGGHAASADVTVVAVNNKSGDIAPVQPDINFPGDDTATMVEPITFTPDADYSQEAAMIASQMPSISASDLEPNADGVMALKESIALTVAQEVISAGANDVTALPVFEAPVDTVGGLAVVAFDLKGSALMAETPADVDLLKVFSSDRGERVSYAATSADFGDKTFTVTTQSSGNFFTGNIDPDGDYRLIVGILDGGSFDLDGKADEAVWDPLVIVSADTPRPEIAEVRIITNGMVELHWKVFTKLTGNNQAYRENQNHPDTLTGAGSSLNFSRTQTTDSYNFEVRIGNTVLEQRRNTFSPYYWHADNYNLHQVRMNQHVSTIRLQPTLTAEQMAALESGASTMTVRVVGAVKNRFGIPAENRTYTAVWKPYYPADRTIIAKTGLRVKGSQYVDRRTVQKAADITDLIMSAMPEAIVNRISATGDFCIFGPGEHSGNIPEQRNVITYDEFNRAEGYGGNTAATSAANVERSNVVTGSGEIINAPDYYPAGYRTGYQHESILAHEFGHKIHSAFNYVFPATHPLRQEFTAAFANVLERVMWTPYVRGTASGGEYIATLTAVWYNAMAEGNANGCTTREELYRYDRKGYDFFSKLYSVDKLNISPDWLDCPDTRDPDWAVGDPNPFDNLQTRAMSVIAPLDTVFVPVGTAAGELTLPEKVQVAYADSFVGQLSWTAPFGVDFLPVTWDTSSYNGTTAATYTITGTPTATYMDQYTTNAIVNPDGLKATVSVVVGTAATGVTLDKSAALLNAGSSVKLNAVMVPDGAMVKPVTWASGNTAVATVDETGLVTGVAAGSSTVTVTTEDGFTASAVVTVVPANDTTGEIVPTEPDIYLPPSKNGDMVEAITIKPANPENFATEADLVATMIPNINAADLALNADGMISVTDGVAAAATEDALGREPNETVKLPVFEAPVEAAGNLAVAAFNLKGSNLLSETPAGVNLIKVLSADAGESFRYAPSFADFGDMTYTITTQTSNEIFTGNIAADGDYKLIVGILDGGAFDLDGQADGTVWDPLVIVGASSVSALAISGVTAPVVGAVPVSAIPETDQYTGTVTWTPAVAATFAYNTPYTATVTLTLKAGYTIDGVTANSFTVAGATATNAANSNVVRAVFPATAAEPQAPVITTTALTGGKVGESYNATLAATGEGTITWSFSGSVPGGLSVSNAGIITGTPTTAGTYNFTATASNAAGSSSKLLSVVIAEEDVITPPIIGDDPVQGEYPTDPDDAAGKMPGFNVSDLVVVDGHVTVDSGLSKTVADGLVGSGATAEVVTMPVIEAPVAAGETAAVTTPVTGAQLGVTNPADIKLMNMLGTDSGELLRYAATQAAYADGAFTLVERGTNIPFTGTIDPNAEYELMIFVTDGGTHDNDHTANGTVVAAPVLVHETTTEGGGSGGGCNAGFALLAFLALPLLLKKKD